MKTVTIDRFRIVPAPLTGIGWVAVQEWDVEVGAYRHVSAFRTKDEADFYAASLADRR